mgnify:CR=1 FL=1
MNIENEIETELTKIKRYKMEDLKFITMNLLVHKEMSNTIFNKMDDLERLLFQLKIRGEETRNYFVNITDGKEIILNENDNIYDLFERE